MMGRYMTILVKVTSDATGNLTLHRYAGVLLLNIAKLEAQSQPASTIKEIIEDFRVN